jgi:hypothetical protein
MLYNIRTVREDFVSFEDTRLVVIKAEKDNTIAMN